MNLGFFDDHGAARLLPLTWLRAGFELVCGRDTLGDKIAAALGSPPARLWLPDRLAAVVTARTPLHASRGGGDWCLVNGRALATTKIDPPQVGTAWVQQGELIAAGVSAEAAEKLDAGVFADPARLTDWAKPMPKADPPAGVRLIRYPWDLIAANGDELRRQGARGVGQRPATYSGGGLNGVIHHGVHMLSPADVRVASGAIVKPGTVLDASDGPIWIDADAIVEPNCVIQGPCSIGRASHVQPGAIIRHDTTIGPVCKVGGEIEASIMAGYSNKQHDGFLGHSYVAPWVNLGADTVTSDLKNTYGTIRVSICGTPVETGQMFVGSIIGEHAKTGIGTILPTGCVIGVAANVFTRDDVPKFVPSFSWLTSAGIEPFRVDKAIEIARTVMARRSVLLTEAEEELIRAVAAEAPRVETGP